MNISTNKKASKPKNVRSTAKERSFSETASFASGHKKTTGTRKNLLEPKLARFVDLLTTSGSFELRHVVQVAENNLQHDSAFDSKLVGLIQTGRVPAEEAIRILRVLECICSKPRLLEHLLSLKSLDGRVRSKVTLTVGRLVQNVEWIRTQIEDGNPRVRSNAVEALWGSQLPGVETLFTEAAKDPHNRVVANAVVGLHKMGNPKCIGIVNRLLKNDDDLYRRSGLWTISQTADPRYMEAVQQLLTVAKADEELELARQALVKMGQTEALGNFLSELTLDIVQVKAFEDGLRVASLACIADHPFKWLSAPELNAMSITLSEGGRQIEEYGLRPVQARGPLSAVVVIPKAWSACPSLFRSAWPAGSDGEKIAIIPFASTSDTVVSLSEQDTTLVFESRMEGLAEKLTKNDLRCASSLESALTSAVSNLEQFPGWRHIVLLVDSETPGELSPKIKNWIRDTGIKVHALVSDEADAATLSAVRGICNSTRGRFEQAASASRLSNLIMFLRAEHFGLQEICWINKQGQRGADVKIKVRTMLGQGEAIRTLE